VICPTATRGEGRKIGHGRRWRCERAADDDTKMISSTSSFVSIVLFINAQG
jgi:hypothetical protein